MAPARSKPPRDKSPRRAALGARGEALARRFLRRRGLKILAENYRCPAGEVDLIALDRATRAELGAETIAFVEVKTRRSDQYAEPQAAVTARKRRQIERAARYYLDTHEAAEFNARFDVVSIVLGDGQKPRIDHVPDAF